MIFLVNRASQLFRGGWNTFAKQFIRSSGEDCTSILMNDVGFMEEESSSFVFDKNDMNVWLKKREASTPIIFSTMRFYESDARDWFDIVKDHPILMYLHSPRELEEKDEWILEYTSGFLYDRPKMMEWFDKKYDTGKKYRHELTLPFHFYKDETKCYHKARIVTTFGRIIGFKGMNELAKNAESIEGQVIIFGYMGGDNPKKATIECDGQLQELCKKDNITYVSAPFGLSEMEIQGILRASRVFVDNLQYSDEDVYGVQYTALEAMSLGCIPSVSSCIYEEFNRQGFWAGQIDSDQFAKSINVLLDGDYKKEIENNYNMLEVKEKRFLYQLEEIEKDLS